MKISELPSSEYSPFYHKYILVLGDVSLMDELQKGKERFLSFLEKLPEDKLGHAYAEGKWTLAELVVHIIDAERVFQYRSLRFARNDKTPLPGFEQDDYVPQSNASKRTIKDLMEEYKVVRDSTILLFQSFDEEALKRVGVSSGSPLSTRATGFIISGHQAHHLKIITERYL